MASDTSANFITIPKQPQIHIQKITPGPPREIAPATPAIFPVPTVAARAVQSALYPVIPFCAEFSCTIQREKYPNAFGNNRRASVEEIGSVKVLTVYYHIKYGGIRSKIRIFFYDNSKNIIIKIIDDGTLSKNEIFLKSLKYNHIKIIREEKYDY